MSPYTFNISSVLHEVRNRRRNENVANAFKLLGIICAALAVAGGVMLLVTPHRAQETLNVFNVAIVLLLCSVIDVALSFIIIFWPFLLCFWTCVCEVRNRTLLSLIQTAVETGKPLQNIVRAYASSCSYRYAAQLNRFAAALDSGRSLEAAVQANKGLFRYDIAGMIRLGGGASETLCSLETVSQDARHFETIRTSNVVRIVYLCSVVIWMSLITTFQFVLVVPQFENIFRDFDNQLPLMTTVIIAVSNWFVCYWYLFFPFFALLAAVALVYLILQTNVVILRPFGLRRVFRSTDAAKFLMVFAVGVRQRLPIPAILEMYSWTVPSAYLRNKGTKIRTAVEQGRDWIVAVRHAGFVSRSEASLLQSAQRTGNTAAVLDQLALSKERSQIRKDDLFSKLAFIPLIFLLGAFIGTFVIAMFLPLLALITALS